MEKIETEKLQTVELKTRRHKLGLSQAQLATKLGTTQNTIYRWENGLMKIQNPMILDRALKDLEKIN